jgi:hypothetical protein
VHTKFERPPGRPPRSKEELPFGCGSAAWWDRRFRLSPPALAGALVAARLTDFFSACDEFPGGLCLVGQVENLRAGWQPALSRTRLTARFLLPASMFGCDSAAPWGRQFCLPPPFQAALWPQQSRARQRAVCGWRKIVAARDALSPSPLTCSALCRTITTSATRGVQNDYI